MEYVLICQSLFVRINHSDELSVVDCILVIVQGTSYMDYTI